MTVTIRRAHPDDADAIRALVRSQPRMNPTGLDWPNFHVAARDGILVGTVQLRPSAPGVAELGSLVVAPQERGHGLARRLVTAAMETAPARVMVVTAAANAHHYLPWGFRPVPHRTAPRAIRLNHAIGQMVSVIRLLRGTRPRRMLVLETTPAAAAASAPTPAAEARRRAVAPA